jgi:HEPN domain-containing protein
MSTKDRVIRQWIQKADNDLKSAEILFNAEEVLWENVCTLSQQAAEKYLKALLLYLDVDFRRSHSLVYLLGLLEPFVEITARMYAVADFLTPFAVDIRYPGEMEVNSADAEEAILGAQMFRDYVLSRMSRFT